MLPWRKRPPSSYTFTIIQPPHVSPPHKYEHPNENDPLLYAIDELEKDRKNPFINSDSRKTMLCSVWLNEQNKSFAQKNLHFRQIKKPQTMAEVFNFKSHN